MPTTAFQILAVAVVAGAATGTVAGRATPVIYKYVIKQKIWFVIYLPNCRLRTNSTQRL
jgi:hypothetical protein